MRNTGKTNSINVQTNIIPTHLTTSVLDETARGIALYYKDGQFICQTFFTQPIVGEVNILKGLETNADVHIRSIQVIGPNLLHVRLLGAKPQVIDMCEDSSFYNILRGISTTMTNEIRSRRYLETTSKKEGWNCIVSLDQEKYSLLNNVQLDNTSVRINNLLILGDRLIGLTEDNRVVEGHLAPEILLDKDMKMKVSLLENVNKLGRITLLSKVPNSETSFLVTVNNTIYQFDVWGEMLHLNTLDESVEQINSVTFNHTRSIMATTNGLYEIDVQELPNMVITTSMPRQIINENLKQDFRLALYVDDPYTLGMNPQMGIFAKTRDDQVMFF